jgi:hypothetical protein
MVQNKDGKTTFDIAKEVDLELDWLHEPNRDGECSESSDSVKVYYKGINSLTKEDDNSAVDCENVSLSVDSEDSDEQYSV